MSDYTPTTDRVRDTWAGMLFEGGASDEEQEDAGWDRDRSEAQFDRWLASVKAEAGADMLDGLLDRYMAGEANRFDLPMRTITWLRAQPEYKTRYPRSEQS